MRGNTETLRLALVPLLLTILLGLVFPRPLPASLTIADMASLIYDTLEGPSQDQLSPTIKHWEEIYKTYTEATLPAKRLYLTRLLKEGINGDLHSLAMATVLAQDDPDCAAMGQLDGVIWAKERPAGCWGSSMPTG